MTINITNKQLTIGAVCIGIAIIAIILMGTLKKTVYLKRAKECHETVFQLNYMASLLSAELHDTWSEYILDDKVYFDSSDGKFYKSSWSAPSSAEWCSSFSEAIEKKSDYYEDKGVEASLDSLYSVAKKIITKMTPAPQKYSSVHADITNLFHTSEAMYNCATSPEGNLRSYTESINSLSADFKKQNSQVDIEIGEIDEEKLSQMKLEILLKFL